MNHDEIKDHLTRIETKVDRLLECSATQEERSKSHAQQLMGLWAIVVGSAAFFLRKLFGE